MRGVQGGVGSRRAVPKRPRGLVPLVFSADGRRYGTGNRARPARASLSDVRPDVAPRGFLRGAPAHGSRRVHGSSRAAPPRSPPRSAPPTQTHVTSSETQRAGPGRATGQRGPVPRRDGGGTLRHLRPVPVGRRRRPAARSGQLCRPGRAGFGAAGRTVDEGTLRFASRRAGRVDARRTSGRRESDGATLGPGRCAGNVAGGARAGASADCDCVGAAPAASSCPAAGERGGGRTGPRLRRKP